MLSLVWQRHQISDSLPSKISIPSTFPFPLSLQCYFENPVSIIACFPFFHIFLTSNFIKFQLDSTPIGNLWLCGLIKYNRFQISGNKSNETEEVKFLRSRNWLYTIFIRKTNLKLDLQSFNIFGSCEYEKMDIL